MKEFEERIHVIHNTFVVRDFVVKPHHVACQGKIEGVHCRFEACKHSGISCVWLLEGLGVPPRDHSLSFEALWDWTPPGSVGCWRVPGLPWHGALPGAARPAPNQTAEAGVAAAPDVLHVLLEVYDSAHPGERRHKCRALCSVCTRQRWLSLLWWLKGDAPLLWRGSQQEGVYALLSPSP